jgi:hypothetical protein
MTVFVSGVSQVPVIEKSRYAPEQVRMHRRRVAVVQPAIRYRDGHPSSVKPSGLGYGYIQSAIACHDFGRNLIHQLEFRTRLDPQNR